MTTPRNKKEKEPTQIKKQKVYYKNNKNRNDLCII